jgi:chromosome partitioning protein
MSADSLARTVAVINGKGGVGKTSIVANVGGLLALAGYRVLLVDLDPQGNLGEDLGFTAASDGGAALARAVLYGEPLKPVLGVRSGLDVCPAGEHLDELAAAMAARVRRDGDGGSLSLARSLSAIAAEYDVILLDCPPGDAVIQALALGAARWVVIPTKTDASSRKGLREVARRFVEARTINPELRLLGVVLFGVGAGASRVRDRARELVEADLGGVAPVLDATIRHVEAAAADARERGELAHEMEATAAAGPKWWERRRGLKAGPVIAASATSLAADYQSLAHEIVNTLVTAENADQVETEEVPA